MSMHDLYLALADVFDSDLAIEAHARQALIEAADKAVPPSHTTPLAQEIIEVMSAADAHPACKIALATPLPWAPPETSPDALYVEHSLRKAHVELVGPDGLVYSDTVRAGLYGIQSGVEYGIRTHPAEEVFVMMAGEADWMRGDMPYTAHKRGERSHHPSMMPHATRTRDKAFMSAFVWYGDVSTDGYVYEGLPG